MRERQRVIRGNLNQQVAIGELGLKLINGKQGERVQPGRSRATGTSNKSGAKAERDGQACGVNREFRLGVGEGSHPLRETARVIGEDAHHSAQRIAVNSIEQVETDKRGVRLRIRIDAGLVYAVERHLLGAIERGGWRGCVSGRRRATQRCIHADRRSSAYRADSDDSPSEEELSSGRRSTASVRIRAH